MCKNMFSHKMYYWYSLYLSVYILLLPFLFFLYLRGIFHFTFKYKVKCPYLNIYPKKRNGERKERKHVFIVSFGGINRLRTLSKITWINSKSKSSLELLPNRLISMRPTVKSVLFLLLLLAFLLPFTSQIKGRRKVELRNI